MGFLHLGDQWVSLLIAIPLFGAFLIPLIYAFWRKKEVAPAVALVSVALGLLVGVDTLMKVLSGHIFDVIMGGYLPPMGINWHVDRWGAILTTLIYLIGFLAAIYSIGYVKRERWIQYFSVMLVMIAGATGVAMTGDLFNMFVFLEVATISAYILVSTDPDQFTLEASLKYLVLGSMATSFILLGIAILYGAYHTLNIYDIATKMNYPVLDFTSTALLLVGLGVEAALFPLGSWLPDAHPSAPSPISSMLSGTLIKIGLVGAVRVLLMIQNRPFFSTLLGILLVWGIITAFWGEFSALRQKDIKRLLAHSSSAQMGYIVAALSTFTPIGIAAAIGHMIVHALSKSLLFMSSGTFIESRHTRDIESLRGAGRSLSGASFAVGALSLLGLPPLPGFFSKFLILVSVYMKWGIVPAMFILAISLVEVFYYLRLLATLFGVGEKIREHFAMAFSSVILALSVILLGLLPSVFEYTIVGAGGTLQSVLPYKTLMVGGNMLWVVLAMVVSAIICLTLPLRALGIVAGAASGGYGAYLIVKGGASVYSIVAVLVSLASFGVLISHLQGDGRRDGIKDALLLLALSGMYVILTASSLFALLYWWEVLSVIAVFMFFTDEERALSGVYYATMMSAFSYLLLMAVVMGGSTGNWTFSTLSTVSAVLVVLAMALKMGVFPFHVWADYGYKDAHPVVAGYLSGSVSKMAFWMLFMALMTASIGGRLSYLLILLAGITTVWAGYRAITSDDLMGILAYSSISQMAYVLAGVLISGAALGGALLHALGHAVFETGLFIVAYVVLLIYGTTNIEKLRGKGGVRPVIYYLAILLALSLAGVPPLSGFVSKWLIYQGALTGGYYFVVVLLMVGSAMSMMYALRFIIALSGKPEKGGEIAILPLGIYSLITLAVGIYPWPFFRYLSSSMAGWGVSLPLAWKDFVLGVSGGGLYTSMLVVVLFVMSFALFLIFYAMGMSQMSGKVYRGGAFYEPTDENLPSLSDMVWPMAHVSPCISYFDKWHEWLAIFTGSVADVIRGVYTGYLPDYALYMSLTLLVILQVMHI